MNVLIVDDSVIYRHGISKAIEAMPNMTVVGTAINGKLALDKIAYLKPDIVTMDLEMPEMDGISAIKAIRLTNQDIKIIVFSDSSERGAAKTLQALQAGANDFLPKSIVKDDSDSIEAIRRELEPRMIQFLKERSLTGVPVEETAIKVPKVKDVSADLVLIGSSTGGPELLRKTFLDLKSYQGPPILICQHMPPLFTEQLARMLAMNSGLTVVEGASGMKILPSTVYIAPGDYHMKIAFNENKELCLQMDQGEKVKSVRPAVDVLFQSVAHQFNGAVAAFVLTGMGDDGVDGIRALRRSQRNSVFIQNESSAVVWGMPGAVFRERLHQYMIDGSDLSQVLLAIKGGKNI